MTTSQRISPSARPPTRTSPQRILSIAAIVLGILLLLAASLFAWWIAITEHPGEAPTPPELAGLTRTALITGPTAVTAIHQLHNSQFPLRSGAVAQYGRQNEITLWVAGAPLALMAQRMVDVMEEQIQGGETPFQPLATRTIGGRTIFDVDGLGQRHFYLRSGAFVIWIEVNYDLAEDALSELLMFYP